MFTSFQAFVTPAELPDLHHTRKTTCCTQLFLSQCLHFFCQREAFLKPQKTSATRDRQFVSTPALIVTPPPLLFPELFSELFSAQFQNPVRGESTEILNTAQEGNNKVVSCFVMIRSSVQGEAPSPSYLDEDLFLTKR